MTLLIIGVVTGLVIGVGIEYGLTYGNISPLQSQVSALQSQIASLQSQNTQLNTQYQAKLSEITSLQQQYASLNSTYNYLLNNSVPVTYLSNSEYYPQALSIINSANSSIYLSMYSLNYYYSYPTDYSNYLIQALVNAKNRGVDVRVIVDDETYSDPDGQDAISYLKSNSVTVKLDPAIVVTHTKMMVVDGKILFVGSHNWSYYGLQRNNEYSVMVKGDMTDATSYFYGLWSQSTTI
jgi:phosphatidylserine/phosphatidylglycerophosphate/cardiolipin synthase-like enzyme